MTEDINPKRPNAKYKLSNENAEADPNEGLTFYYNRERRLEKAPPEVRALYSKEKHKFNLLRPLIADKPRAFTFITIVLMCIMIVVFGIMGFFDNSYSIEGNKLEINAVSADGITIIAINKTVKDRKNAYTGAIDIGVSAAYDVSQEDMPDYFSHRIFFTMESTERFSFTVPFDSKRLAMVIQSEKTALKFTLMVD